MAGPAQGKLHVARGCGTHAIVHFTLLSAHARAGLLQIHEMRIGFQLSRRATFSKDAFEFLLGTFFKYVFLTLVRRGSGGSSPRFLPPHDPVR